MIIVIITTSILLLLGFNINKISHDSYKMKQINSICKKNFYIAEALSQEAEIRLQIYLNQALDYSYEIVSKEIMDSNDDIDKEKINFLFKSVFEKQINTIKVKMEDTNSYSLKYIDGYKIYLEVNLQENLNKEEFNLEISSIYDDKEIVEKINTKYIIRSPEYYDSKYNQNLLEKVSWVNYKW